MTLSHICGFCKFVNNLERKKTACHLQMFYHPQMRQLTRTIL